METLRAVHLVQIGEFERCFSFDLTSTQKVALVAATFALVAAGFALASPGLASTAVAFFAAFIAATILAATFVTAAMFTYPFTTPRVTAGRSPARVSTPSAFSLATLPTVRALPAMSAPESRRWCRRLRTTTALCTSARAHHTIQRHALFRVPIIAVGLGRALLDRLALLQALVPEPPFISAPPSATTRITYRWDMICPCHNPPWEVIVPKSC